MVGNIRTVSYALTIKLFEECPRCHMPPGIMCVYTRSNTIHRDPVTRQYVDNEIGKPMIRPHVERNRNVSGQHSGKYSHQPDFDSAVIVVRPENDNPNGPLIISAPCVCEDETHHWTAAVYEGTWSANRHVPETG